MLVYKSKFIIRYLLLIDSQGSVCACVYICVRNVLYEAGHFENKSVCLHDYYHSTSLKQKAGVFLFVRLVLPLLHVFIIIIIIILLIRGFDCNFM